MKIIVWICAIALCIMFPPLIIAVIGIWAYMHYTNRETEYKQVEQVKLKAERSMSELDKFTLEQEARNKNIPISQLFDDMTPEELKSVGRWFDDDAAKEIDELGDNGSLSILTMFKARSLLLHNGGNAETLESMSRSIEDALANLPDTRKALITAKTQNDHLRLIDAYGEETGQRHQTESWNTLDNDAWKRARNRLSSKK